MPPSILWILAVGVVLFVVLHLVKRRKERERSEALGRLAETVGLSFQPVADLDAVRSLGRVQLFERGHSKRVTNLMTGRMRDRQVAVFDYRYTVGYGKNRRTSEQTVVVLPSAKRSLPDLQMAPENPLTRIAEVFGYQDIDIESSPEFSRRYIVRGANEEAIRLALYPGATTYFAAHEGWTVETQSGNVGVYRANARPKPEEMREFIESALAAADAL